MTVSTLVCLPGLVLGQEPDNEGALIVEDVRFEGNRAFDDDELRRAIATRESGCKTFLAAPLCWIGFGLFQRREEFDPRELRTDVARIRVFYFRRGYRSTQVDTTIVRGESAVRITFTITEGEPVRVRSLQVVGLEGILDSSRVVASLPVKVGDPFGELAIAAAEERLATRLRNRGYARAQVLRQAMLPADDPLSADVVLEAIPGPKSFIGDITVQGARKIEPQSVVRLLNIRPGDLYREDAILRSQRNLYSLALFEFADIRPDLSGSDSIIDVRVQVNEADIRDARLGFGLTTAECLQIEAGWTHRNFLGGTRRLEISGGLSNILTDRLAETFPCSQAGVDVAGDAANPFNDLDWRVRAEFQQPWFFSADNSLRLGLFAERQSLPRVYARKAYGGDLTFARTLASGMPVTFTYRGERDELDAGSASFLFCANFGVCRPEDIGELASSRWLASMTTTLTRNRTNAVLDPTQGYRFTLEFEHGSRLTGAGWEYNRALGEVRLYHDLGGGTVLAGRIRGGWVRPIGDGLRGEQRPLGSDVTHPLKRLFAGGATTVRGYSQNLLGPKVLLIEASPEALEERLASCFPPDTMGGNWVCDPRTDVDPAFVAADFDPRPAGGQNMVVSNIELRFPMFGDRWRAAAFVDIGQVWNDADDLKRRDSPIAWSPGFGVRYLSPVGPLRLDVGYNTGGGEARPVVAQLIDRRGRAQILQLTDETGEQILFDYDPFDTILSRLRIHFSIGQAF